MNINLAPNISKKVDIGSRAASQASNKSAAVVLLIVAGIIFSWYMLKPEWQRYQVQAANLKTLQGQEQSLSTETQKLAALIQQLKLQTADVSHLDQALPLNGKTVELQIALQTLAQSSGVTIGEINFPGKNDHIIAGNKLVLSNPYAIQRTLQKLTGSINVSGSYDQVTSFIKKVETDGRLIDINSLEMASDKQGVIDLKLSADAYYYE